MFSHVLSVMDKSFVLILCFYLSLGNSSVLDIPNWNFEALEFQDSENGERADDISFRRHSLQQFSRNGSMDRSVFHSLTGSWQALNGRRFIPYEFDESIGHDKMEDIYSAMGQWMARTCVRFVETGISKLLNVSGGILIEDKEGEDDCFGQIGLVQIGLQPVNIGKKCTKNVIAQVLGHTIGLGLEHSREDRDSHIVIFEDNIADPKDVEKESFFYKNYSVPYNYQSVMHPLRKTLAGKDPLLPTILPKDVQYEYLMTADEDSHPVSHYDALLVNRHFRCEDQFYEECGVDKEVHSCQNYGFFGCECKCICPRGTSGPRCETLNAPQLPAYETPRCGGVVSDLEVFNKDKLGVRSGSLSKRNCIWILRHKKPGNLIKVRFGDVKLSPDCQKEFFEVRWRNTHLPKQRFCGSDLKFMIAESNHDIVLWYYAEENVPIPILSFFVRFYSSDEDNSTSPTLE